MATEKVEIRIDATDKASPVLKDVASSMGSIDPAAKRAGAAADQAGAKLDQLGAEAQGAGGQIKDLGNKTQAVAPQLTKVAAAVAGVFAVDKLIQYGKSVNQIADEYKNLEAGIKLAIGPNEDLAAAVAAVGQVATETFSNLDATAALYSRLAASSKELGISNNDALQIAKTINQSIQVSGASAQASEASVRQLVQALQSGTLRGDEFNSIMEQAPRLAKALAEGLGVPIGALRGMAEQGEITSARVVAALKGQADAINTEFASLPLTTGRALEKLNTQWTLFIGNLSGGAKESSVVAQGISALADNLDELAAVAERAGAVITVALAVKAAVALRTYAAEVLAAKKATSLLALEMSKVPTAINITVGFVGLEAGYQFGTWLHENTESARRFGAEIVGMAEKHVNSLIFLKEAAAAVFSGDTIDAAYDRWQQRTVQLQQTLVSMREDAKKAPSEWKAEADAAAAKMDALGASAKTAGTQVAEAGMNGAIGLAEIKPAADAAAGALQQLQEAAKAKPETMTSGIQLGLDLKKAHAEGKDLVQFLEGNLPAAVAKLSGPELEKFKTDFQVAMQVAGTEGKVLETGLRIIGERAAQSLGVDLVEAGTRVGAAFQASEKDLGALIDALPALKAAGVDTGKAVGQALEGMIGGAKNQAEVDELRKRIEALRKVLGDKLSDGLLQQLREQAEKAGLALENLPAKVKTVAERTAEAFKSMGLQTEAELKKAATDAVKNFELIKASGQATAEGLSQAWQKMAEASIAANGGVASETLRAEAAMHGLEIATDQAGKSIVRAANEGADGMRGYRDSVDDAKKSVEDLAEAERKRLNVDKDGFSLDKSGNRLAMGGDLTTLTGIKNFLQQAGLEEEQAKKLAREFADSKGDIPYFSNPGQLKYGGEGSTMSQALLKAAERMTFGMGNGGAAAVGGGGSSGQGGGNSTTHNVTVDLGGGRKRSFKAASADDAAAAAAMLKELETVAGRSSR